MTVSTWLTAHGEDLQVLLFFGGLAVLAVAERLAPRRATGDRRRRWLTNYALTALNLVVLMALPVTLIGSAAWAQDRGWGLFNRLALPAGVAVVATLLVRAFVSFATHWLMHKVPVLWRFHRVHHLDTELDVSTTVRFHPLESVLALGPGVALVVAFGLSPWVLIGYELLDVAVTLFSHANLRLPPAVDRVLRYLIVTPDLHRIHHSSWQPETDSNFGAVFPIWDLVFCTFRSEPRTPHPRMTLGLDEVRGPEAQSLRWLLASPRRSV